MKCIFFQTGLKKECFTESRPNSRDPNLPCIFPFRYKGVSYNTCTLAGNTPSETKPWCSTFIDDDGDHVSGEGHWGNCGPDCPLPVTSGK